MFKKHSQEIWFKNVINSPKRITSSSETKIDLILTSDAEKITKSGTWINGLSDQHRVYAVVNVKKKKDKPILKEVHDYKNIDRSKFEVDFDTAALDICNVFDDVEDSVWAWELLYKNIMKDHIKNAKLRSEQIASHWLIQQSEK